MKILVLLKRVPDTAAKLNVAADGLSIDPSGVEFVINPYDEIAVEQAIRLKEEGVTSGGLAAATLRPGSTPSPKRTKSPSGEPSAEVCHDSPPPKSLFIRSKDPGGARPKGDTTATSVSSPAASSSVPTWSST